MPMLPGNHPYVNELDIALPLVRRVAAEVNSIYNAHTTGTWSKADGSPVTDADLLADRLLRETLSRAFPGDGLLTEESEDTPDRLARNRCWIADPVDGTAQFVARTGNFDVMLALVVDHRTHLAICGHPPSGTIVVAILDHGTWIVSSDDTARRVMLSAPSAPPILTTSIYYAPEEHETELAAVAAHLGTSRPEVRSSGYGPRSFMPGWRSSDAFVGFWRQEGDSPVREWDLAACDLITTEAGGAFTDLYGERYAYNQPCPRPRSGLLATANPRLHQRLVAALAPMLPERG